MIMGKTKDSLERKFEEAGLGLKVLSEPIRGGGGQIAEIVQLDIGRRLNGSRRTEFFRVWKGNEGNRVEVLNIDKKLKQLVLLVHEPKREFEMEMRISSYEKKRLGGDNWLNVWLFNTGAKKEDVVRVTKSSVIMRQSTSSSKRHFLLGVDERQLFIAQLARGVSAVREAHASLGSTALTLAEGKQRGRTKRQGEWFFLNVSAAECETLRSAAKKGLVQKKVPIGTGGNPHVADELVHITPKLLRHGFSVHGRDDVYVRGKIRHVDHKTISFKAWRKVIRNNEGGGGSSSPSSGVFWID